MGATARPSRPGRRACRALDRLQNATPGPARRVPRRAVRRRAVRAAACAPASGTAFGLPEPLPPYVAIAADARPAADVLLGAVRSSRTQTARSPHPTAHERASVRRVIDHGAKHNLSVTDALASIPGRDRSGALRTAHVRALFEHGVRDGQLAYDPDKAAPCTVGGTLAASSGTWTSGC